jgi:hypothetical protein
LNVATLFAKKVIFFALGRVAFKNVWLIIKYLVNLANRHFHCCFLEIGGVHILDE